MLVSGTIIVYVQIVIHHHIIFDLDPYDVLSIKLETCRGIADEYAMEGSSQCVFRDVG